MPLPFILGALAATAASIGVKNGVSGAIKMKDANDTIKEAKQRHSCNVEKYENQSKITFKKLDEVGEKELNILKSFEEFSNIINKIQNRPEFKGYNKENVEIPQFDAEELKKVSIGAGVLLGGLTGAALGTAGGFAAAGATTAAVTALGTASTGTAIASLSGVAATNATLAALGGGALAAGGGGMALGTTILGASTLGVGLLVGGFIFNVAGGSLSNKADEAWEQMLNAEKEINEICLYLTKLHDICKKFYDSLMSVDYCYRRHLKKLAYITGAQNKKDWDKFTEEEKRITENTILLVGLLFSMCKVKLVIKNYADEAVVNEVEIRKKMKNAENILIQNYLYC